MRCRRGLLLAAGVAVYVLYVRPWMLRWGATEGEGAEWLPGDDVVSGATLAVTRAIDIAAPPVEVWPWLVQIGIGPDRAGFYSYDWLENLLGLDVLSASRIIPQLQAIAVGDRIPLGPETHLRVQQLDPGAALILHARMDPFTGRDIDPSLAEPSVCLDWTWSFVLRARPPGTRLLLRTRGTWAPPMLGPLVQPILEPPWFVMERRMLLGIRERAEGIAAAPAN